jgi:DNA (cytosine-5)-methyltransferase 1
MTAAGQCWELPTLERRTSGTGSGCEPNGLTFFHTPNTNGLDGGSNSRKALQKRQWPTPTASQARSEGSLLQYRALVDAGVLTREEAETMCQGSLTPPRMKARPTPTVCGNYNRKGASATSGDGLATAVYQTPVARMWKDNGKNPSELERNSPTLAMQAGGALNPTWVEWLMGWPLGWTDLKPLATDKSHSAQQPHGGF